MIVSFCPISRTVCSCAATKVYNAFFSNTVSDQSNRHFSRYMCTEYNQITCPVYLPDTKKSKRMIVKCRIQHFTTGKCLRKIDQHRACGFCTEATALSCATPGVIEQNSGFFFICPKPVNITYSRMVPPRKTHSSRK